jgi:hypothetical protein
MSNQSNSTVATMGIDIGKNSFHVVGLDQRGAIVLRQKWSRGQVEARLRTRHHQRPSARHRQLVGRGRRDLSQDRAQSIHGRIRADGRGGHGLDLEAHR